MEADKRAKLLERLRVSAKKSAERHKQWHNEIPDSDRRCSRMVADISICLSEIMQEKGITQRDLASKMGVSESAVSRLMGPDHNPTLRTLAKLESAVGEMLIITPHSAFQYLVSGSVEVPEGQSRIPFRSFVFFGKAVSVVATALNNFNLSYMEIPKEVVAHKVVATNPHSSPGAWNREYNA